MQSFVVFPIGMATLTLAVSYAVTARWGWMAAILLVGLLWLAEPWHRRRWVSSMGLIFFIGVAVLGVLLELAPFWLLTGIVTTLVAWDLDHLARYLASTEDVRNKGKLIGHHLRRLAIVAGLGWSLGAVALSVKFTFGFILTLALGLLAVISLSGIVRFMRRESEEN